MTHEEKIESLRKQRSQFATMQRAAENESIIIATQILFESGGAIDLTERKIAREIELICFDCALFVLLVCFVGLIA